MLSFADSPSDAAVGGVIGVLVVAAVMVSLYCPWFFFAAGLVWFFAAMFGWVRP